MTRPDCPASPLSSLFPALLASLALGLGCAGCNSGSSSGPASYVPGDDTYVRMGSTLETARAEHALAPVGSGVVLVSGSVEAETREPLPSLVISRLMSRSSV